MRQRRLWSFGAAAHCAGGAPSLPPASLAICSSLLLRAAQVAAITSCLTCVLPVALRAHAAAILAGLDKAVHAPEPVVEDQACMSCRVRRRPAHSAWRSATERADGAQLRVARENLTATCGVRGSFRIRGTCLPCCTTRRPWLPSASTSAPCASRQAAYLPPTRAQRQCIVLFPSGSVWSRMCLEQAQVSSCCEVDWWACNCDGSRFRRALLVPLIPAAPHGSCKWPRCRSSSFLLPHLLTAARSDE